MGATTCAGRLDLQPQIMNTPVNTATVGDWVG